MDLRLVRYFVAVAEELSFTRAAERLHIAQPSLSQQIQQLEAMIGAPLLSRNKHRVELTEPGRVFLREARIIMSDVERAVNLTRQSARSVAGMITIAMLPGPERKWFSTVVSTFLRLYPDIRIVLRSLTSVAQVVALKNREINVGLLRGPITDTEIAAEVLAREDFIVLLPADSPLARLKKIPLRTLATVPHIGFAPTRSPALHNAVNKIAEGAGIQFLTVLEVENITTLLNAVAAGLGFALQTEYAKEIKPKNVVARPLDVDPVPQLEFSVAYRKDDKLPALTIFLSLLRDSIPSSS